MCRSNQPEFIRELAPLQFAIRSEKAHSSPLTESMRSDSVPPGASWSSAVAMGGRGIVKAT